MQHEKRSDQIKIVRQRILELSKELTVQVDLIEKNCKELLQHDAMRLREDVLNVDRGVMIKAQRELMDYLKYAAWQTLRATARHGGRYYSKCFGDQDFFRDVARVIKDLTLDPWDGFFSDTVAKASMNVVNTLLSEVEQTITKMKVLISSTPELKGKEFALNNIVDGVNKPIESGAHAMTATVEEAIAPTRNSILNVINKIVQLHMHTAIADAARQSGDGTKQRMIEDLKNGTTAALSEVLIEVSSTLSESVDHVLALHAQTVLHYRDELILQADQIPHMFSEQPDVSVEIDMDELKALIDDCQALFHQLDEVDF